jgi:hypothetical protein
MLSHCSSRREATGKHPYYAIAASLRADLFALLRDKNSEHVGAKLGSSVG